MNYCICLLRQLCKRSFLGTQNDSNAGCTTFGCLSPSSQASSGTLKCFLLSHPSCSWLVGTTWSSCCPSSLRSWWGTLVALRLGHCCLQYSTSHYGSTCSSSLPKSGASYFASPFMATSYWKSSLLLLVLIYPCIGFDLFSKIKLYEWRYLNAICYRNN